MMNVIAHHFNSVIGVRSICIGHFGKNGRWLMLLLLRLCLRLSCREDLVRAVRYQLFLGDRCPIRFRAFTAGFARLAATFRGRRHKANISTFGGGGRRSHLEMGVAARVLVGETVGETAHRIRVIVMVMITCLHFVEQRLLAPSCRRICRLLLACRCPILLLLIL